MSQVVMICVLMVIEGLRVGLCPTVTPGEMAEARRWVAAKFEGVGRVEQPQWGLAVVANYDELCKNSRMGRPLTIGKTEFARGLFCHAVSKISVRLPGPGRAFTAVVGVDSNSQTRGRVRSNSMYWSSW